MPALLVLALSLALSSCGTVSVAPGHRAVALDAHGRFTVLGEGTSTVGETIAVTDFDLRAQALGGTFDATTADGVTVVVHDPVVQLELDGDRLVELARGVADVRAIVSAELQHATSVVIARHRWDELDARLREAQTEITALAAARLLPRHVLVRDVELKGVTAKDPALAAAARATSVWEQRALAQASALELARSDAARLHADALGIAAADARLAPTLTPPVLADAATKAFAALLAAPTTQLEVTP